MPVESIRPLGFIGLGRMGAPMAARLVDVVDGLRVLDRVESAVDAFVAAHPSARAARSASDLADCRLVILMLPDSTLVERVVLGDKDRAGLIDVLAAGALVIDMGSSQPLRTRALGERLRAKSLRLLDAPVSGGVRRAVDGSLAIMVGGEADDLREASPLLQRLGRAITHVGGSGAGHAAKALNNYVSAAGLLATAEALHAGRAFGLDPAVLTDVFNGSTGRNNTTENKVKPFMLSGTFDAGFALSLMTKDLATAMALGEAVGAPMALGREVLAMWQRGDADLGAGADHTEMFRWLAPPSGDA